ncbi:MAG: 3-deoxy-8-phosphooctulonate synthase, partial [Glaciimonas sp.]|nr:3-deoxy-8-phosphooctulonate synthase [Glaciimonas sp.]
THPDPSKAMSDGPNAVPLGRMKELLSTMIDLDRVVKKNGFLESNFA